MANRSAAVKITGLILAAGHGTRMHPLTDVMPKPLLPVLGIPLLSLIIERLMHAGASHIHANTFHLADRIARYVGEHQWPLTLHREPELLGTGGGIGTMLEHCTASDVILLQNGDILTSIDFAPAVAHHRSRGALVTMLVLAAGPGPAAGDRVSTRRPAATVHVDGDGAVLSIGNGGAMGADSQTAATVGGTGMAVISPDAIRYFPRGEPGRLVDTLHAMIREEPGSVITYAPPADDETVAWGEIGSPAGYIDLHRRILIERAHFDPGPIPPPLPLFVGEGSRIDPGATWQGFLAVGSNSTIESNVTLEDCVVLDGTVVEAGSAYRRCVVFPGGTIPGDNASDEGRG